MSIPLEFVPDIRSQRVDISCNSISIYDRKTGLGFSVEHRHDNEVYVSVVARRNTMSMRMPTAMLMRSLHNLIAEEKKKQLEKDKQHQKKKSKPKVRK